MSVEVTPEQLPVVGGKLGGFVADALESVTAAAPLAIPAPPGADFVSAMLTTKATEHAGKFFPCALQGIGCGADGAAVLPTIGSDYVLADVLGQLTVATQSRFL